MRAVRYGLIGASSAAIVAMVDHFYPLSRQEAAAAVGILIVFAGFGLDFLLES